MAIVQLQLKPNSLADLFLYHTDTVGEIATQYPVMQQASIYPLINTDWQLLLNAAGSRVLVFNHDNANPNPTGTFNDITNGNIYDIPSTSYTAP